MELFISGEIKSFYAFLQTRLILTENYSKNINKQ